MVGRPADEDFDHVTTETTPPAAYLTNILLIAFCKQIAFRKLSAEFDARSFSAGRDDG